MTPRGEMVRRVQVGLAGLGIIVMILFIASAIASRLRPDVPRTGAQASGKTMEKSPDPAAKLGIAPANAPENAAMTNAAPPQLPSPTGLPSTAAPPTTQPSNQPSQQPATHP